MLEQVLTQAMSYIQLITAALLLIVVVLEVIHVLQTRRINKKLSYAGSRLLQYLKVVFDEEEQERAEGEEGQKDMQVNFPQQQLKSQQEEDMRVSLENKKQKKDEELLDTVLQEIFD